MNYKFTGGYFKGHVCDQGATILDQSFEDLPGYLQRTIVDFADLEECDDREALNEAVKSFERSFDWQGEETDEPITLLPVSQWAKRMG